MQFSRLTTTPAVPTNGAAGFASGCKTVASDLISRQFPAVLPRTSTRPSVPRPSPLQGSTSRPASDASSSSGSAPYAGSAPSPSRCAPRPSPTLDNAAPRPLALSTARQNLHGSPTNETLLTIPPPHRRTGTPPAAPIRQRPTPPSAAPLPAFAHPTRTSSSCPSAPAPSQPAHSAYTRTHRRSPASTRCPPPLPSLHSISALPPGRLSNPARRGLRRSRTLSSGPATPRTPHMGPTPATRTVLRESHELPRRLLPATNDFPSLWETQTHPSQALPAWIKTTIRSLQRI